MSPSDVDSKEAELYEQPTCVSDTPTYDERATKRLLRKIDWLIMPLIVVIYLMNFIDRLVLTSNRLDEYY